MSAPESWEDRDDVNSKLSDLNVNAPVFVPNVFAPAFVPSFLKKPEKCENSKTSPDEAVPADGTSTEEKEKVSAGSQKEPIESWEDHSGSSSVATTPEDEDVSLEENSENSKNASKPRIKIKPKVMSETTTEKEHVNVVFIGHVDAGKSTIGGQIMHLTGMVDKRTLEKYEREARKRRIESPGIYRGAWIQIKKNVRREKTVEVGRAYFETEKKHFTILDAPGHKSFVPNMIGGAAQADLAVLVISARKGEFETGFERGGQTCEHAMLVKTAGVKHLVILINKMDDPTVGWSEDRYNYCKDNLSPYLKKIGFNTAKDIMFMPCSGLMGSGIKECVGDVAPWHKGESFISYIDSLPPPKRNTNGPFMMPIVDKFADMGTVVIGKVESGDCKKGQTLSIYPNRTDVKVDQLWSDDIEVTHISCGENVKVKLKGVEENDITPVFDAQIMILEHKSIICAGKSFVLHLQAIIEEVQLLSLICLVDKKTNEKSKTRPRFIRQDQVAIVRFEAQENICMERFQDHPQLGRFALRDEGKTIAIGKVLKLINAN
ncbi:ERF3 [Lepeophtheirus salmonis]|uniref:ERF3 n=1 Tax=Lepeophtheirus salmonis TaxID=72036 RepID=A0A7R8GZZ2_LEPSM|nr:ERF3 [Lepeophtheirus salmonis]CAF2774420.1 ERF3 [Lepeophtheirus salmonis]